MIININNIKILITIILLIYLISIVGKILQIIFIAILIILFILYVKYIKNNKYYVKIFEKFDACPDDPTNTSCTTIASTLASTLASTIPSTIASTIPSTTVAPSLMLTYYNAKSPYIVNIPVGCTSMKIDAIGGAGGSYTQQYGGGGGAIVSTLININQISASMKKLYIFVGGNGSDEINNNKGTGMGGNSGGYLNTVSPFNSIGSGGNATGNYAGGGGGATIVFYSTSTTPTSETDTITTILSKITSDLSKNLLIVAGGGGGSTSDINGLGAFGAGGWTNPISSSTDPKSAAGGTYKSNGITYSGLGGNILNGGETIQNGGNGGDDTGNLGGGGGGGYPGGKGGNNNLGGGAGGSKVFPDISSNSLYSISNTTYTPDINKKGLVSITFYGIPPTTTIPTTTIPPITTKPTPTMPVPTIINNMFQKTYKQLQAPLLNSLDNQETIKDLTDRINKVNLNLSNITKNKSYAASGELVFY